MTATVDGFSGAIGNTPLIRLPKLSAAILGMIEDFERRGLLQPGGVVVVRTAAPVRRGSARLPPGSRVVTILCDGGDRCRTRCPWK
jgi:cysteine synthase